MSPGSLATFPTPTGPALLVKGSDGLWRRMLTVDEPGLTDGQVIPRARVLHVEGEAST